jgi:hypothetical protein
MTIQTGAAGRASPSLLCLTRKCAFPSQTKQEVPPIGGRKKDLRPKLRSRVMNIGVPIQKFVLAADTATVIGLMYRWSETGKVETVWFHNAKPENADFLVLDIETGEGQQTLCSKPSEQVCEGAKDAN